MEVDPRYCDVILARAAATFGDAVPIRLVEGGGAEVAHADVVERRRAEPAAA